MNKGPTTAVTPLFANLGSSVTTEFVLSQQLELSHPCLTLYLVSERPAFLVLKAPGRSLGPLSATFACLATDVTM